MSGTSFTEQSANADKIRTEAATKAAEADTARRRREALDAPKIAAAQAEADRIARAAKAEAEQEERDRAARVEAERAAKEEQGKAGKAEAERLRQVCERDLRAAKAVKWFAVACFLVALPLQLRTFWSFDRPWEVAAPLVLESGAWVLMRMAEAAIIARRRVWHYLAGAGLIAAIAATVNVADGVLHPEVGVVFGLVGGFCSLAGPSVWALWEFAARAKTSKATRAERKIAEAAAKQAAAELEQRRAELKADADEKTRQAEEKRATEEAKRAAHEAKVAADKAAAQAEIDAQDEQRRTLFPEAWKRYESILAAHPLGAISRDRAWDEARRAADHPDVYARYQILTLNGAGNVKPSDLWAEAWRSVKGLPLGQTIETLSTELAAREYVEQVIAEHMTVAEHIAVEELLANIFGRGDGGPAGGGNTPRKSGPGGPSKTPGALGGIENRPSGRAPRTDATEPLQADDIDRAKKLRDAVAADQFSTPAVAKLLGRSKVYARRIRDAVQSEQS